MSVRAGAICRFNWDGCLGDSPPGLAVDAGCQLGAQQGC